MKVFYSSNLQLLTYLRVFWLLHAFCVDLISPLEEVARVAPY